MSHKNKNRRPMPTRSPGKAASPDRSASPESLQPPWTLQPPRAEPTRSICPTSEAESRRAKILERLAAASGNAQITFQRADRVEPMRLEWLADGRVPQGALCVLAGEPGTCKSLLATEWMARVSEGPGEDDAALVALGIDLTASMVRTRLDAAGANVERLACAELDWLQEDEERSFAQLDRRIAALEAGIQEGPGRKLLVVDNLEAWADGLDATPCRARKNYFLVKLAELAMRTKTAVVVLARLNGPAGGRVATRELAELSAIAPVVWLAAGDADDPKRRLLLPIKNSLGPKMPGAAFQIEAGRVAWDAEPVEGADSLPAPPSARSVADQQDREDAADWLLSALGDGPVESAELFRQARSCGISAKTLRRAGKALGLKPGKAAFEGPWLWKLGEAIERGGSERGTRSGECGAEGSERSEAA